HRRVPREPRRTPRRAAQLGARRLRQEAGQGDHRAPRRPRRPTRHPAHRATHAEDHRGGDRGPYYVTARLAAIAVDQWARLDGHAAAHGLPDLRTLPVERFANFVWYMSTKGLDVAGI